MTFAVRKNAIAGDRLSLIYIAIDSGSFQVFSLVLVLVLVLVTLFIALSSLRNRGALLLNLLFRITEHL